LQDFEGFQMLGSLEVLGSFIAWNNLSHWIEPLLARRGPTFKSATIIQSHGKPYLGEGTWII
jgi:hypothetical protein